MRLCASCLIGFVTLSGVCVVCLLCLCDGLLGTMRVCSCCVYVCLRVLLKHACVFCLPFLRDVVWFVVFVFLFVFACDCVCVCVYCLRACCVCDVSCDVA